MELTKKSHRIFAYGTLKQGQPNHHHMKTCEYIGSAVTDQPYPLIVATHWNLPFLLDAPGEGKKVIGELYDLDDDLLTWMDNFEGHPTLYVRDIIKVHRVIQPQPPRPHHITDNLSSSSSPHNITSNVKDYLGGSSIDSSVIKDCSGISKCSVINDSIGGSSDPTRTHELSSAAEFCSGVKDVVIDDCVDGTKGLRITDDSLSTRLDESQTMVSNGTTPHASLPLDSSHQVEPKHVGGHVVGSEVMDGNSAAGACEEVWVYLLRKFPPGLIKKETYSCYDSYASHQRSYHPNNDLSGPDTIKEALEMECA